MRVVRTILALAAMLPAVACLNLHRDGRARSNAEAPRLAIGHEQSIPETGSAGRRRPAVAYGGGLYLLVWREGFSGYRGQSDILALRIAPDGKPSRHAGSADGNLRRRYVSGGVDHASG